MSQCCEISTNKDSLHSGDSEAEGSHVSFAQTQTVTKDKGKVFLDPFYEMAS